MTLQMRSSEAENCCYGRPKRHATQTLRDVRKLVQGVWEVVIGLADRLGKRARFAEAAAHEIAGSR